MGDLIYMNNNDDEGVTKRMVDGVNASGLKKGIDFNIISFMVLDRDFASHSLGGFLGKNSTKLFKNVAGGYRAFAESLVAGKSVEAVAETPYPKIDNQVFYRINEEVDIDLATEIGLGVVLYKGEYLLYCPSNTGNPMDAVSEMLTIKVYFQLKHPDEIDMKLKSSFEKYQDIIMSNMIANSAKHMNRLKEIFTGV